MRLHPVPIRLPPAVLLEISYTYRIHSIWSFFIILIIFIIVVFVVVRKKVTLCRTHQTEKLTFSLYYSNMADQPEKERRSVVSNCVWTWNVTGTNWRRHCSSRIEPRKFHSLCSPRMNRMAICNPTNYHDCNCKHAVTRMRHECARSFLPATRSTNDPAFVRSLSVTNRWEPRKK
jgi:hypothetical protein